VINFLVPRFGEAIEDEGVKMRIHLKRVKLRMILTGFRAILFLWNF
jgi:hypothetical protein